MAESKEKARDHSTGLVYITPRKPRLYNKPEDNPRTHSVLRIPRIQSGYSENGAMSTSVKIKKIRVEFQKLLEAEHIL